MCLTSVDMNLLLASLALSFFLATLAITVEIHIFAEDAKTAPESARLEHLIALLNVGNGFLVAINALTSVIATLKLQIHQVLFHSPMHLSPLDSVVTEALFGATVIFFGPRRDA